MTGISVCPPVIVLWLILHIIMAINQTVNICDYSHLHRGRTGEKKRDRGKQMRNEDVEEMIKLSTARSTHTVCCCGLSCSQPEHYVFDALVLYLSIGNMTLSLKENVQGAPQSSFNASAQYVQYMERTVHYTRW